MAEAKAYKMIPHCTKDTITYEMDELVRCKDCQRKGTYDCPVYVGGDGMCSEPDEWFCADGVAKDINVLCKEGR